MLWEFTDNDVKCWSHVRLQQVTTVGRAIRLCNCNVSIDLRPATLKGKITDKRRSAVSLSKRQPMHEGNPFQLDEPRGHARFEKVVASVARLRLVNVYPATSHTPKSGNIPEWIAEGQDR